MKWNKAILGGALGASVMSVIMAIARGMGMRVNLEQMLGTMTGMMPSGTTFAIGLVVHLMMGVAFAVAYAWLFEQVAHRGNWTTGALVAIPHIVFAGLMMGAIPMFHPLMPNPMAPPGVFMSGLGAMGVGAMVMLHLIFGAIVGGVYGDVRKTGHVGLGTRASLA